MPSSVTDWVTSLLTVGLIVLSAAYCVVSTLIARARRRHGAPVPGVYPGTPEHQDALEAAGVDSLAGWHALSTAEQEAADTASLDLAEQAELDAEAEDDAREAAEFLAQHVRVNALYHP